MTDPGNLVNTGAIVAESVGKGADTGSEVEVPNGVTKGADMGSEVEVPNGVTTCQTTRRGKTQSINA